MTDKEYPLGIVDHSDNKKKTVTFFGNDLLLSSQMTSMGNDDERDQIPIRGAGPFIGVSYYLDGKYDWQIIKDNEGVICLVPTNKE